MEAVLDWIGVKKKKKNVENRKNIYPKFSSHIDLC